MPQAFRAADKLPPFRDATFTQWKQMLPSDSVKIRRQAMTTDFRRMEQLCLEQAALCTIEEAREGLKKVALGYRIAAEAAERQRCAASR
jgi:hypothetical protein